MSGVVREVKFGDYADIPALMEAMAAEIRDGKHGNIKYAAAVFIDEDGMPIVNGWGQDVDDTRAIGILQIGAHFLARYENTRA